MEVGALLSSAYSLRKEKQLSLHKRNLNGNKVLLTGGASGLGAMVAKSLVEKGATVFLIDKSSEVENVASKIGAHWTVADVTDLQQMERAAWKAVATMEGLDTVFVNAGIGRVVTFEGNPETFHQIIDVNVVGTYNTIRACMSHISHPDGYMLINASMGGIVRLMTMAEGYGASKAAAATLGHAASLELIGTGAKAGVVYLAEHDSPMEDVFYDPVPQEFMAKNPLLRHAHKARNPEKAVRAIVRGIEHRKHYIFEPKYAMLAGHFPILTNVMVRLMHQNVQSTLDLDRNDYKLSSRRFYD